MWLESISNKAKNLAAQTLLQGGKGHGNLNF